MEFPENLKYTKDHEWLRVEGGVGTVGITDYAQSELGDVVFVELPQKGKQIAAGASFGTIEAVKAVSELFAPVSGEVLEINPALVKNAELVNKEPYDAGWMVKVKMQNPAEANGLMSAADYKKLTGQD